ncbi:MULTISPECIES: DEAD/DEAH box helicase [Gordonibacter]|uniref:DEAD/DEAH box helicase n=1 Tax=Gordonibacter faecis TaxID=3047475 RepID=A0ABT7DJJ3_9ACTN|nr:MULTISPECIES: DEAD/DEAH box helicase [unclassified Gordonibacter]MDJ1649692.1 DEAD/DEAH box helicase [Gordonibacter sp. KGMB12511]HIW76495.1 DEAD/DEAH box helicase [Candidatus Gordonibacter avicola]
MSHFADLGLSSAALAAVERLGYDAPTPVQEQAIPLVLEGRDLIAAASTGTGKTAAFLLPTLSTLPRAKGRNRAPRVLVVSPTRELAQQIARTCMQISRKTGHFVTTVFGGTPYGPQIKELRGGTDVLIATPGRLKDLMKRGVVDLGSVQVLVLDEADRMLDMGFLPDVTTIVDATPDCRQTLLFSATIDRSIERNLGSLLNNPAIVEVARNGETAKTVAQYMMPIKNYDKPELLRAVLEEKGSERVIVFARTKNRTEDCAEALCDAGYRAESIHSDKSQGARRRALENFRRGKTSILVATDVLARGIDVPDVDHVINFDLPDMPEDYIHRIGRTGRAGEEGYAISFVTRETSRTLRDIERLIGKDIPFMELETYELDPAVIKPKKGGAKQGGSKGYGKNYAKQGGRPAGKGGYRSSESRSGKPAHARGGAGSGAGASVSAGSRERSEGAGTRRFEGAGKPAGAGKGGYRSGKPGGRSAEARYDQGRKAEGKQTAKKQRSKKSEGGYDYSRFAKSAEREQVETY